jgi:uncharacterized membrane protein
MTEGDVPLPAAPDEEPSSAEIDLREDESPTEVARVDGEVRTEVRHLVQEMLVGWAGPMPPPGAVREFEQILPGSAERILALAERQVDHRHRLETKAASSAIRIEERGQWIGATIAVLAILVGGFLVFTDHDGVGFSMVITAIGGLLAAAIFGRRSQTRDLSRRRQENAQALARREELAPDANGAPDPS